MSKIDLEGWNPILQSIRRWVRRASKWWRHLPVLFRRRTTWRAERCRHVRKFCSVKSRFTYTVVIITQLTQISTWLVSWTEKLDKIHRRNPLRPLTDWVRWFSWWFDHGGSFYSPANQLKRWNNEIKVWMKVELPWHSRCWRGAFCVRTGNWAIWPWTFCWNRDWLRWGRGSFLCTCLPINLIKTKVNLCLHIL